MWSRCLAIMGLLVTLTQHSAAQTILGYQISSSVKDYLALTTDVCTIVDAMTATPYNFKLATETYTKGKASGKKLKDIASTPRDGEAFFEKYKKFFGSATWMDSFISDALAGTGRFAAISEDGRSEAVKKGIQSGLLLFYMMHELDAALRTLQTRSNADNQNEGAGHNVDEAFAIWVGDSPGCGLYGVAERRANEFGTRGGCGSPGDANLAMVEQFTKLKGAAKAADVTMFTSAYDEIMRLQYIVHAQSSLKYAITLDKALGEAKSTDSLKGDQVEGYVFYRAIAPLVAEADAASSRSLEAAWNIDAAPKVTLLAEVEKAFNATYVSKRIDQAKEISEFSLRFDCPTNTLPATSVSLAAGAKPSSKNSSRRFVQFQAAYALLVPFLAVFVSYLGSRQL